MKVAVLIPAYKVKKHIIKLVQSLDETIVRIYVVDDNCPEKSGSYLEQNYKDKRMVVIYHNENRGVGGALITAYKAFLNDNIAEIAVKLDGDGQMNPNLISTLIKPLIKKDADYVKGNRFFNIDNISSMPNIRILGNSILSLINKVVNGYWHIMDPTNGFTAIHITTLKKVDLNKIDNRFFFESDMLFRLGIIRAVVKDMPMDAVYNEEESNLKISKIFFEFPPKYFNRFCKRIFYNYLLRDFNAGSLQLILGTILFAFGVGFGIFKWWMSIDTGEEATAGTIMLAALPIIMGFQLLLGFLNYDIQNVPKE